MTKKSKKPSWEITYIECLLKWAKPVNGDLPSGWAVYWI